MKIKNFLIKIGVLKVSLSIVALKIINPQPQDQMKERRVRVFSFDVIEYITKISHNFYHCLERNY